MKRILIHAINATGLGHIVRLAWVATAIEAAHAHVRCEVVTTSRHADPYFERPCTWLPCDLREPLHHATRLRRHIQSTRPDVVVFDTRWPPGIPELLRQLGIRGVLIARAVSPDRVRRVFTGAQLLFDSVIVPHTIGEVEFYYRDAPDIVAMLNHEPFSIAGPIARVSERAVTSRAIVFTLGGGGEYLGVVKKEDQLDVLVNAYIDAAIQLRDRGHVQLGFVAGPFFKDRAAFESLTETSDHAFHSLLGPNMCVVSRGGYNTCWEAIGAGSHLVLASSHTTAEDVDARCEFLSIAGFARRADGTSESIVDSIERGHAERVDVGRRLVNAGLADVVNAVLG